MKNNIDKAIFTTKQILSGNPIVYIYHDLDDEWQFLGAELVSSEDIRIITLKQLLSIDSSTENVLWMPPGMEALRKDINSEWETRLRNEVK